MYDTMNLTNTKGCANYKMKNFIFTYIVKTERETFSPSDITTLIGIALIILNIVILSTVTSLHNAYDEMQQAKRVDLCRIKNIYFNKQNDMMLLCKSQKTAEILIININETSENTKHNPYINRPIIINKDGTFK